MSATLCQVAANAAEDIHHWITACPTLQEESITDRLLYEMARQSTLVCHYQHTRKEESWVGADWDWWIDTPGRKFAFRVQAKRMRPNHNHRADILYKGKNQARRQIDLLIATSTANRLYPMYSLYGLPLGSSLCRSPRQHDAVFVSPARDVFNMANGKVGRSITERDLQSIALPMPCLFCCPLAARSSKGPIGVLDSYFGPYSSKDVGDDLFKNDLPDGIFNELPSIVRELFEVDPSSEDAQSVFDNYREQFVGTNGILLIRVE